jgi:hypothetical protein
MDCSKKEQNKKKCNCSATSCSRHGLCCECIEYHRTKDQLPACYFDDSAEKTWNRNIDFFISLRNNK